MEDIPSSGPHQKLVARESVSSLSAASPPRSYYDGQRKYSTVSSGGFASGAASPTSGIYSPRSREGCFAHMRMSASAKFARYFKRLFRFQHMDFEFACWQMIYLLVSPQKVYRNFMYRKRTKDQWARDDPAFLVLLSVTLAVSSILFALVLGLSFVGFIKFLLWVIFIDFIGTGVVIATTLWLVANGLMRSTRDHDVEWGYAWDVHLNAFFPLLVILHIVLPILYPVIGRVWLISAVIGNILWFIAICYYIYVTFLGYTALGFLRGTQVLLYPVTFLLIGCVAVTTVGWNITGSIVAFYHYRVQ